MEINQITEKIIGAAIEVHRALGAGLFESVHEECLCYKLQLRQINFSRQHPHPEHYKGKKLDCGYRIDLLVVELKAVEEFHPIHEAQLLTYQKLGRWKAGLLINFNVPVLNDGIRRRVLNFKG